VGFCCVDCQLEVTQGKPGPSQGRVNGASAIGPRAELSQRALVTLLTLMILGSRLCRQLARGTRLPPMVRGSTIGKASR
jgi:hypothetical protein